METADMALTKQGFAVEESKSVSNYGTCSDLDHFGSDYEWNAQTIDCCCLKATSIKTTNVEGPKPGKSKRMRPYLMYYLPNT